jgi:hypothetical protein
VTTGGANAYVGVKVAAGFTTTFSTTSTLAATTNTGPTYVTTTSAYKPTGSTTGVYTATTVAPNVINSGTVVIASPLATAPCLNQGYLSQNQVMYSVDIIGGGYSQLVQWKLSSAALSINSLGYNPLDSYLYGTIRGVFPETFARLGFDGTVQPLLSLNNTAATAAGGGRYYIGDIDTNGQYYAGAQTQPQNGILTWFQINLNPALPDYG